MGTPLIVAPGFDLKIFKVTIGVMRDHTSATHCIQVLRGHKFSIYPLTPRNYWRAVGMQLQLAGFVDDIKPITEPNS